MLVVDSDTRSSPSTGMNEIKGVLSAAFDFEHHRALSWAAVAVVVVGLAVVAVGVWMLATKRQNALIVLGSGASAALVGPFLLSVFRGSGERKEATTDDDNDYDYQVLRDQNEWMGEQLMEQPVEQPAKQPAEQPTEQPDWGQAQQMPAAPPVAQPEARNKPRRILRRERSDSDSESDSEY
jgi:hypothetical protein